MRADKVTAAVLPPNKHSTDSKCSNRWLSVTYQHIYKILTLTDRTHTHHVSTDLYYRHIESNDGTGHPSYPKCIKSEVSTKY